MFCIDQGTCSAASMLAIVPDLQYSLPILELLSEQTLKLLSDLDDVSGTCHRARGW